MNFVELSMGSGAEPRQFLAFARHDLAGVHAGRLANALSNAKRAIDGQVDRILIAFGAYRRSAGFPAKLAILETLGIATPGILRRVNANRNRLEHQFRLPRAREVEDAVDVAMLFLDSTDFVLNRFPEDVALGNMPDDPSEGDLPEHMWPCITLRYRPKQRCFAIYPEYAGGSPPDRLRRPQLVHKNSPEFRPLVAFVVSVRRRYGADEALGKLCGHPAKAINIWGM